MNLSVEVVIPVHDGWELTRSCLEHLSRQTLPHTVFVVDDGSSDGTSERLQSAFPAAHLVRLDSNRGFATACNRGVRAGVGDVVVLLNNDVDCPPDFLESLVAPFRDDARLGSVTAVLTQADGMTIDSAGLTADKTLASFPRFRGQPIAEVDQSRTVLTGPAGAAGAYRRAAWEQVGGLDEGVFMYGEDLDLAFRLRSAGWPTALAADAVAVHLGSASIGHRTGWQRYHGGFARGYFLRRYGVLRGSAALRTIATETIVVVGDAVLSRDLSALRGRVAGWRAAAAWPRLPFPPPPAIEERISFTESLQLRRQVYAG